MLRKVYVKLLIALTFSMCKKSFFSYIRRAAEWGERICSDQTNPAFCYFHDCYNRAAVASDPEMAYPADCPIPC